MSDLHRARARAEAFARALDDGPRHSARHGSSRPDSPRPGSSQPGSTQPGSSPSSRSGAAQHETEFDDAVEMVGRLREAGAVMPRPEFTAELRHRLLEQAAARAATAPTVLHRAAPEPADESPDDADEPLWDDEDEEDGDDDGTVTELAPRRGRRIRLIVGTTALVLLGGGIGSAAVAQQAMPGDPLYGVKRSIENVSTNVGVGDDSRGRRELEHAMTRLNEVKALAAEGGDAATINTTLADFTAQARRGVTLLVGSYQSDPDPASITTVTTFLTSAGRAISELAPALPPESLKSAVEALATIEQLSRQTTTACPDCAKPTPAVGRTGDTSPRPDPTNELSMVPPPSVPSPGTSGGPSSTNQPSLEPTPSGQQSGRPSTAPPPPQPSTSTSSGRPTGIPSGTPTGPDSTVSPSPRPSQPSTPTPSAPNWPWPLPTISLPPLLPSLNVPGLVETLLPRPPAR